MTQREIGVGTAAQPRGVHLQRVVREGSTGSGRMQACEHLGAVLQAEGTGRAKTLGRVLPGVLWLVRERRGRPWRAQDMLHP